MQEFLTQQKYVVALKGEAATSATLTQEEMREIV